MRVRVPATMSTSERVAVAVPESVCRKFSAVRSPVTMLRAGPAQLADDRVGRDRVPSAARQLDG